VVGAADDEVAHFFLNILLNGPAEAVGEGYFPVFGEKTNGPHGFAVSASSAGAGVHAFWKMKQSAGVSDIGVGARAPVGTVKSIKPRKCRLIQVAAF